jgi:hypothetical protein
MFSRRIGLVAAAALFFLTGGLGCYETKYPLGSAQNATVNRAFVGNFTMPGGNNAVSIVIRNLDDKQYYVEWSETGQNDKGPLRMVGYTADVKGVTFANLRSLSDDGTIDDKFLVMRVSLSADGSKLTIRNLNDKLFSANNIDSQAALNKTIESNLDNNDMYDGDANIATRDVPTTQGSATIVNPPPSTSP